MNLRTCLGLLGAGMLLALVDGCAPPASEADDATSDSDLTQSARSETAAEKLVKLTPLPSPVRPEGAAWSGKEFRGTGEKGKACTVHVFHFDRGPAVEIVVNDDGETNDMVLASGLLPSHLEGFRADDHSLHFEDWWIEDQADRNHEVDVKRFDAVGGGVSIRTKKLGFDKVVQCWNLTPTTTSVVPPEHFGE